MKITRRMIVWEYARSGHLRAALTMLVMPTDMYRAAFEFAEQFDADGRLKDEALTLNQIVGPQWIPNSPTRIDGDLMTVERSPSS